jgi:proteasome lid subunit RPN8/RPN11
MLVNLKQYQLDLLKEQAYQQDPIEVCALLFGKVSAKDYFIEKLVFVPNSRNSTVEFEIDPQIVLDEINKAEIEELKLIGFFHSHPASPYPSIIDLQNMNLWMEYVWLIFSLTENKIAAYLVKDNILEKVQLRIDE